MHRPVLRHPWLHPFAGGGVPYPVITRHIFGVHPPSGERAGDHPGPIAIAW